MVVTLPINEQPFGELQLVDDRHRRRRPEPADPRRRQQRPGRAQPQRPPAAPGDSALSDLPHRRRQGLVAKQAYVLDIEYPDDVARAIFVANRAPTSCAASPPAPPSATCAAPTPPPRSNSLAYPQTGAWKNYRSLFYLHERFFAPDRPAQCRVRQPQPAAGRRL